MHDDKASLPKLCNAPLLGICMDIKNNMFLMAIFYSAETSLTKTKGGCALSHNYVGGSQA